VDQEFLKNILQDVSHWNKCEYVLPYCGPSRHSGTIIWRNYISTQSYDSCTIMAIKPRSKKSIGSGRIGTDGRLNGAIWQIMVFITTVLRCPTPSTLLIRFYHDVTKISADQRPRSVRLYDGVATMFKIILRCYTDLEDRTTTSLRWCRSYHACSPFLLRFMRWSTFILGFQTLFVASPQTSNMNGRIDASLIHFALLQHEKCWLKFKLHRSLGGRGAEKG
jgi:hypothetical protein